MEPGTIIALIFAVLIYGVVIFFLVRFIMIRIKVKRLRDYKCIFTGEYFESKVTRDESYTTPDREVRYARVWAGELEIDEHTTTIKGEYVHGHQDCILTSPSLGYKVSRCESSAKNTVSYSGFKTTDIKFEVVSYGSLNEKQKKTLTKVVKAAKHSV